MSKLAFASAVVLLLLAPVATAATSDLVLSSFGYDQFPTFEVLNAGPDTAQDVVLTIDVPSELQVELTFDPDRDERTHCDMSARPIRCTQSSLATAGEDLRATFRLQGPPADATYTLTATVTSASTDPDPLNNSSTYTYETRQITSFSTSFEPAFARLEPGSVQVINAKVGSSTGSTPHDIRIHFESANATIESIEPANPLFTCSLTSSTTALCTGDHLDAGCLCAGDMRVTLRTSADRAGGEARLSVSAESNLPDLFPHAGTALVQTYRMIGVTSTADTGPGSLREAIHQANAQCTPGPCKLAFEIAAPVPAEGWFTITPATELPPITAARVVVDGTSQTRLTGDTNPLGPEIAIEGYLAGRGLEIYSDCDAVVQGLSIGHFLVGDGLIFSPGDCNAAGDRKEVTGNYIGVDPSGTRARPNQRGLNLNDAFALVRNNVISRNRWSGIWQWTGSARIVDNRIEDNGRSGIVLGPGNTHAWIEHNVINRQAEMGIAIAPDAQLYAIHGNSMMDNGGLGIDIGIDGVSSPVDDDEFPKASNAPVLLSAAYDPVENRTNISLALHSGPLGPYMSNVIFDFYANRGPDGDGEQHIVTTYAFNGDDQGRFQVALFGDYRGKWINATSTRTHTNWAKPPNDKSIQPLSYSGEGSSTSELSNAVPVTENKCHSVPHRRHGIPCLRSVQCRRKGIPRRLRDAE